MQNRTDDITRQYWILNDQYRLLNSTIVNAIETHQKVKSDYRTNVRRTSLLFECFVLLVEYDAEFQYN